MISVKLYVIIRQRFMFSGISTGNFSQVLEGNLFGSKPVLFLDLQKEFVYVALNFFYMVLAEV